MLKTRDPQRDRSLDQELQNGWTPNILVIARTYQPIYSLFSFVLYVAQSVSVELQISCINVYTTSLVRNLAESGL